MQVPAILCARSMGLKVIVIDPLPGAPGMALADEAYVLDLADVEVLIKALRARHAIARRDAEDVTEAVAGLIEHFGRVLGSVEGERVEPSGSTESR